MAEPPGEDVLVLPPVPLATGRCSSRTATAPPCGSPAGVRRLHRGRRRAADPARPPARRLVGALIRSPCGLSSGAGATRRIHPHPRGVRRAPRPSPAPPRARRYLVQSSAATRSGSRPVYDETAGGRCSACTTHDRPTCRRHPPAAQRRARSPCSARRSPGEQALEPGRAGARTAARPAPAHRPPAARRRPPADARATGAAPRGRDGAAAPRARTARPSAARHRTRRDDAGRRRLGVVAAGAVLARRGRALRRRCPAPGPAAPAGAADAACARAHRPDHARSSRPTGTAQLEQDVARAAELTSPAGAAPPQQRGPTPLVAAPPAASSAGPLPSSTRRRLGLDATDPDPRSDLLQVAERDGAAATAAASPATPLRAGPGGHARCSTLPPGRVTVAAAASPPPAAGPTRCSPPPGRRVAALGTAGRPPSSPSLDVGPRPRGQRARDAAALDRWQALPRRAGRRRHRSAAGRRAGRPRRPARRACPPLSTPAGHARARASPGRSSATSPSPCCPPRPSPP